MLKTRIAELHDKGLSASMIAVAIDKPISVVGTFLRRMDITPIKGETSSQLWKEHYRLKFGGDLPEGAAEQVAYLCSLGYCRRAIATISGIPETTVQSYLRRAGLVPGRHKNKTELLKEVLELRRNNDGKADC